MKKLKRYLKNVINYFKGMRISTIYKFIGVLLLIAILFWMYLIWKKNDALEEELQSLITETYFNQKEMQKTEEENIEKKEDNILEANNKQIENSEVENKINKTTIKEDNKSEPRPSENKENFSKTETEPINDTNTTEQVVQNADIAVLSYMNETESYFDESNFKDEIKSRFIIIVDFLFYNGKIKGHTLNDLSTKAKLQVLKIALSIDSKIDKYIPGYKETISSITGKIYTSVKSKIIETYLNITTEVCTKDKITCEAAKKDFQTIKKAFSITWDTIKNLVKSGTNNLKEWYEIWSGK